ncbi:glycerophosphodiester phosphodiesterase [Tessaracoccus sp. OH4464_COT-324]|uniref:glycerophosphodiester phosphodiesterase n=1 Tax=Tessaracoccus sp. OH4464_COT-324 TaxID=2491059 RepID=UPI001319CEA0|nr:glycerophosphodiester phosphodiesterase [Tessaracoccus sp. OH4464_COT-324]
MTRIWAHRGASGTAPENTLPAFGRAIQLGADGVEFDVQRTADGHLVVIHDETIDRTSTGTGPVVGLTLEQLRRHSFHNNMPGFEGTQLPLLAEVLELYRGTPATVNIEFKTSIERYPGIAEQARLLVEELGMAEQVLYSSFDHYTLLELIGRVPREAVALLFADGIVEPWRYATQLGAGALHPGLHLLQQPHYVERAHESGLKVNVWTVNEPEHLAAVRALGVDALITNYPERATRLRA